tara:strand:- start:210 stop:503 length:294 start_codon:yes stop_codon:yes gene_type:complete
METFSKVAILWAEHIALIGVGYLIGWHFKWKNIKKRIEITELEEKKKAKKQINLRPIVKEEPKPSFSRELAEVVGNMVFLKQKDLTQKYIYGGRKND